MKKLLLFTLLLVIASCDTGLAPEGNTFEDPGISGKITFIGNWSPDVTRTHIVIFKDSLNSQSDFNALNLRYVSLEIPFGVSEYTYSTQDEATLENIKAGEYAYFAVAQSTTPALSLNRADWNVVGLWSNSSGQPATIVVPSGTLLKNINIVCDLDNPPVQPPGGINE